jgi:hypothetical protein
MRRRRRKNPWPLRGLFCFATTILQTAAWSKQEEKGIRIFPAVLTMISKKSSSESSRRFWLRILGRRADDKERVSWFFEFQRWDQLGNPSYMPCCNPLFYASFVYWNNASMQEGCMQTRLMKGMVRIPPIAAKREQINQASNQTSKQGSN